MAKSHMENIRNADFSINDGVDVRDTKQLSSESYATKPETNSTAHEMKPSLPKNDRGGLNTNS